MKNVRGSILPFSQLETDYLFRRSLLVLDRDSRAHVEEAQLGEDSAKNRANTWVRIEQRQSRTLPIDQRAAVKGSGPA
jgi:hypothetical protein